jgi:predicted nucleotidyltransferase
MIDISTLSPEQRAEIIRTVRDAAVRLMNPERIILFGSAARDQPAPDSDLDILIVLETDLPFAKRGIQLRLALADLRVPMDIIVLTPAEFEKYRDVPGMLQHIACATGKVIYEREVTAKASR